VSGALRLTEWRNPSLAAEQGVAPAMHWTAQSALPDRKPTEDEAGQLDNSGVRTAERANGPGPVARVLG